MRRAVEHALNDGVVRNVGRQIGVPYISIPAPRTPAHEPAVQRADLDATSGPVRHLQSSGPTAPVAPESATPVHRDPRAEGAHPERDEGLDQASRYCPEPLRSPFRANIVRQSAQAQPRAVSSSSPAVGGVPPQAPVLGSDQPLPASRGWCHTTRPGRCRRFALSGSMRMQ